MEPVTVGTRVRCKDEGYGELMHRAKQHGELKCVCSRYEASDGRESEHNTVLSERLFEFAFTLVKQSLGLDAGEAALREKLRDHALRLLDATPGSRPASGRRRSRRSRPTQRPPAAA
jgi:hypothetical protein